MLNRMFLLFICLASNVLSQAIDTQNWISAGSADPGYCGATGSCVNTSVTLFAKGTTSVFYLQYIVADSDDPRRDTIQTAAFYPRVDEYAELVVPNTNLLMAQQTDATHTIRVQMVMIVNNQLYKSGTIAFTGIDQTVVCVPARTLVLNLENGRPFVNGGIQWAQTDCSLAACSCIESICASDCVASGVDLTVRIAWTGTDVNGVSLTSLGSDIWHFENAV